MSFSINAKLNDQLGFNISNFGFFQFQGWTPIIIDKIKGLIPFPGIYSIHYLIGNEKIRIADVCFHYQISPSLSADELYGLKARMLSCRTVILELKCTECNYTTKTYTSIARDVSLEQEGCIWQAELPDKFNCKCGKVEHTFKYYKESLHGLLRVLTAGKDSSAGKVKYERLYSHNIIRSIVDDFLSLLKVETSENSIQKFIEKNPVLLSPFNVKRLFLKPSILGIYEADFAILDATNTLIFIEIEKPRLPLFQQNGHPTAKLNHAYEQVRDWLLKYNTSSREILNRMGLQEQDVNAVKGHVIAGILEESDKIKYQNHQKKNENNNIGFISYDNLASSVLNLSSELI